MVWHRQIMMLLGLVLSVVLLGRCSSSSRPTSVEAAAVAGGASAAGAPLGDCLLSARPGRCAAGDRVPPTDLSGEFTLDGDGYFALPLVGEILGGGRTARQLENEIELALKSGSYLVEPQVSIEVLNYRPFTLSAK